LIGIFLRGDGIDFVKVAAPERGEVSRRGWVALFVEEIGCVDRFGEDAAGIVELA